MCARTGDCEHVEGAEEGRFAQDAVGGHHLHRSLGPVRLHEGGVAEACETEDIIAQQKVSVNASTKKQKKG